MHYILSPPSLAFLLLWLNRTRQNREGCVSYLSFVFFHIQIFMSRQYSNRPYIPSRPRVSLQMCDFASFPPSQTTDTTSDSSSWQLTDPLSCMHQQPTSTASSSSPVPPPPHLPTQNDFSYFQYPPHRHTLESPLITTNREINNNQDIQHLNEPHPSCHVNYLEPNEEESPRPLVPLNLVTVKKIFFFFLINFFNLFIIGCSYSNCFCSTSSSLSFRKSICCFIYTTSTLV